jgi:hypothetical protein
MGKTRPPLCFAMHVLGAITLLFSVPGWAALGDNAPPIPATYNTSHPRLPAPDNAYLASVANNAAILAGYNAVADAWNSQNPGNVIQLRQLVFAYMANKAANPAKAAAYLQKISALADLGGAWGPLLYEVNDGAGNGNFTITSASSNFLTGCGGASCVNNILSIEARTYVITGVPDAHTVTVNQNNAAPSGPNLKIRIFSGLIQSGLNIALIYDWLYNDLDAATRTEFGNELDVLCTEWEEDYVGVGASPYNDVFYLQVGAFGLIGSLAIYPDLPSGLKHLNYATDVWFNVLLPVWNQVFGPEGGGWHESWPDYVDPPGGSGLTMFLVPSLLSWQVASGDQIFARESWLKNFAYYTMYMTRPDFTLESLGDTSRTYLEPEYYIAYGGGLGSINGLAEIYNDPVIRGWARVLNLEAPSGPSGFVPSAWPFYTPDNNSKAAVTRAGIPPVRNFTGWGYLSMRTGWSEDDTLVSLKWGDNFWSHEHMDTGAFTIYSRGSLALDSGAYRAGFASEHEAQYARQTIAHNTITVTDPADYYPTTAFGMYDSAGNGLELPMANDGGQRRIGSPYNQNFPQLVSPNVLGDWLRNWDYYHTGQMVGFASTAAYTYSAVDITAAYNNKYSAGSPNATNRTNRVQKAVRHLLFIPRGTAAYVVVLDQVTSTNASFVKRWLLHTVNQPVVNGSSFTVSRSELVTELPWNWTQGRPAQVHHCPNNDCSGGNQYQYAGKLYGWMVQPQAGNINVVGGPGKEFWIEDPQNPGSGTNWNQCQPGQCDANFEGFGSVQDQINPDPNTAPHEPGSWRIEITPSAPATQDFFLNVMLATTVTDQNVPVNVTAPANLASGMVGATWVDNGNTYTVTFPQSGVGGHITIAGSVDEDLLSHAQQLPAQLQVVSGTGQSGPANTLLASPLIVVVTDAAGNVVPNAAVHFGVTQGAGRLSSSIGLTNALGRASVNLILGAAASGTGVSVMADVNGLQPVEFDFTIGASASPVLTSLSCSPTALTSGATSTCTVSLSQPAGAAGATVVLSTNQQSVSIPASAAVAAGSSSASFTVTAATVTSGQSANITATLNGITQNASLSFTSGSPGVPIPTGNWVMIPTSGSPVQTVGFQKLVYAPSPLKKAVMLGDYHELGSEPNRSYIAYDFESNRWSVLDIGEDFHSENLPEAGHPLAFAYDPNQNMFVHYCCATGSNQAENVNFTWWYDPIGQTGRAKAASPKPGWIQLETATFDAANNTFIVEGGNAGTWTYKLETNTYQQQTPAGMPPDPTIGFAAMAYNTSDQRSYLFGGAVANVCSNDLFAYSASTNTWAKLSPVGTRPAPRCRSAFAYDSTNNVFLLYGGYDGTNVFNDSWIYNPAANSWTQLAPTQSPTTTVGPFEQLAYDSDHNVFILVVSGAGGYTDGSWIGYAAQTWLFRYQGTGPNAGTTATSYLPSPGSINRNTDAWAKEPSLASSGGSLYSAWVETGRPFDTSDGTWFHVYAGNWSGTNWAMLGGTPTALDSEFSNFSESMSPSIAVVAGTPWISWYKSNNGGQTWALYAKSWNGSAWQGGAIGRIGSDPTRVYQGRSQMADVAGVPHIGFLEVDKSYFPQKTFVYVEYWNGSQWSLKGTGPLNINMAANTTAGSVSIASDGTNPYVAWTEYTQNSNLQGQTPSQVYVAHWNGTQWANLGASLNLNPASWADDVSIAYLSGQPYVAWTERTTGGNNQVFVKTFNGSTWVSVGSGTLNKDTNTGWAFRPSLAADAASNSLYIGWVEQQAPGQKAQTYVSLLNGAAWAPVGGSLNAATSLGSAQRVSLAVVGGVPVAAWGEVNFGSLRQVFVKQWNGSSWNLMSGSSTPVPPAPPTPPSPPAPAPPSPPAPPTPAPPSPPRPANPCDLNGDGVVNSLDVQIAINQSVGITVCTNASLEGNGLCDVVDVQRVINASLGGACKTGP